LLWNYNIVIDIEYKCKVEHVLICDIHVNMRWWIVTLWDMKLWTWDLVVNKCVINTWCDNTCFVSCELYNNPTSVYLDKIVTQCVIPVWNTSVKSWVLYNSWVVFAYNIVVEIEYKYKVEHVLIYEIHVNIWYWIVILWDIKLWTWDLIVNKCIFNTWCDNTCVMSCELYNNSISVCLEKSVYLQC